MQARFNSIVARLRDRLILAPFSGLLGFRQVSPGTMLTPNTAITSIDDISTIKLDFTVPETFLGTMTPGAKIIAKSVSFPDREFEGTVRTVGLARRSRDARDHGARARRERRSRAAARHAADRRGRDGGAHGARRARRLRVPSAEPRLRLSRRRGHACISSRSKSAAAGSASSRCSAVSKKATSIVVEGIVKLREGARVRYEAAEAAVSERSQGSAPSSSADARS